MAESKAAWGWGSPKHDYAPRRPTETILYAIVRDHLEAFLAHGEALVGNIGSDKRMEYTVIGDVVNVAARLEAIAQPNQVLVAESTRDLVGEAIALRKLGARKLTGRKTETGVYELEVE